MLVPQFTSNQCSLASSAECTDCRPYLAFQGLRSQQFGKVYRSYLMFWLFGFWLLSGFRMVRFCELVRLMQFY